MKKNRMLRLASALLILTLLTTSVIGGTFAKYVSEGSVSDTARVAKWGVEIKTSGTLYSDAYAKAAESGDTGNLPATWAASPSADSITVAASTQNDNIVAPGTKSYDHGLSFSISGTPEVAVTVKATIKAEDIYLAAGTYGVLVKAADVDDKLSLQKLLDANEVSTAGAANKKYNVFLKTTDATTNKETYARVENTDSFAVANKSNYYILTNEVTVDDKYCPVAYTLGTSTDTKTAAAVAGEVAKQISNNPSDTDNAEFKASYEVSATYAANTNLATAGPKFGDEKLTWAWDYESSDEDAKAATDAKDTLLGDMIAARGATGDSAPAYKIVDITQTTADDGTTTETVTALTISSDDDDYTVKKGEGDSATVVANLRTKFDIKLTVEQVD